MIDRVVTNQTWLNNYTKAEVHFPLKGKFDHTLVVLTISMTWLEGKLFRCFRMWQSFPNFNENLKNAWNTPKHGTPMYIVAEKTKSLKSIINEINQQVFKNIHVADFEARKYLENCQDDLKKDPLNHLLIANELQARTIAIGRHKAHNEFISHKDNQDWITDEDVNTTLFRTSIRKRNNINIICSITSSKGDSISNPTEVIQEFISLYKNLLGTSMDNNIKVKVSVLEHGNKVSQDQQDYLTRPYMADEVKQVVFSISGEKSLGPDGYNSYFLQDN
ncbi:unnamed protein product [Vicia faba]|uniref:Uncharacterized protein n=1 Tax=Vicia faba TaxID=3906 RepID=A0AAV0Z9I9_VICFA|nr:unnamed protein product [Vicia faba]